MSIPLRECRRMTREPLYMMAIILPPLLCYVLFTSLMTAGLPTKLPAAVVDRDGSSTSRAMVRNLGAFQHTDIVAHYPSAHEAFDAMRRGEVYGFYLIPEGMEAEVMSEEKPLVSFYLNYAYLIAGSLLYEDMRTLSELTDAGIGMQLLYAHGVEAWQTEAVLQPVVLETHPLHNPWLNYSVYLNNTLILVFDAYKVKGNPGSVVKYHNIYVVYTKEAETADQYIEKTVHDIGRKYNVTVATSDALEQMIIWGQGATRLSAAGLREAVEKVSGEIRETWKEKLPTERNRPFEKLLAKQNNQR